MVGLPWWGMNKPTPAPTVPKPLSKRQLAKLANPHNFYPTPEEAVEMLLDAETFPGSIWEPCVGEGHITRTLFRRGYTNVWETDIASHNGYRLDQRGDFLTLTRSVNHVVTNPPFDKAEAIIRHARRQADTKVAILLRLAFLESSIRTAFFEEHPPARVWVFRNRLTLYPQHLLMTPLTNGKKRNGGTQAMAWFVWDTSHRGRPVIDWLPWIKSAAI